MIIDKYSNFKYTWINFVLYMVILGSAYYLHAFSSYTLHTWLPNVYFGCLTGTLEVRPCWFFVLRKGPLNALMPTQDMDWTISQRFEPN